MQGLALNRGHEPARGQSDLRVLALRDRGDVCTAHPVPSVLRLRKPRSWRSDLGFDSSPKFGGVLCPSAKAHFVCRSHFLDRSSAFFQSSIRARRAAGFMVGENFLSDCHCTAISFKLPQ